jgi:hypothetical protein
MKKRMGETEFYYYELCWLLLSRGKLGLGASAITSDAPVLVAKALEAMAKVWPSLPHFGDNKKPLVDWDPDDPPLAPCLLVDKDDPVGFNTPSPPRTGGTGRCSSRRYRLRIKRWCAGEWCFVK